MWGRTRFARGWATLAAPAVALCAGGSAVALGQTGKSGWPPMLEGDGTVRRRADGTLAAVSSAVNYQKQSVTLVRSLRDVGGTDGSLDGADWDMKHIMVNNARCVPRRPTLAANGFELVESDLEARGIDYLDDDVVIRAYCAPQRSISMP